MIVLLEYTADHLPWKVRKRGPCPPREQAYALYELTYILFNCYNNNAIDPSPVLCINCFTGVLLCTGPT